MAFGGGLDDLDDVVSEINMTPLVDVMLVLLIVFMLTVPVLTQAVRIDLPRAAQLPSEAVPQVVTISVTRDGTYHWNDAGVDAADLEARLAEAARRQPQPAVHIRGDRNVAYEAVVRAMVAAQRAGIRTLGFVTEPQT